jgi:hypothetical protein
VLEVIAWIRNCDRDGQNQNYLTLFSKTIQIHVCFFFALIPNTASVSQR